MSNWLLKFSLCFSLQLWWCVIQLISWINWLWANQSCFYFQKNCLHLISPHSKNTDTKKQTEYSCWCCCTRWANNDAVFPARMLNVLRMQIRHAHKRTHSQPPATAAVHRFKNMPLPNDLPNLQLWESGQSSKQRRAAPRPPQLLWKIYDPPLTSTSCKHRG